MATAERRTLACILLKPKASHPFPITSVQNTHTMVEQKITEATIDLKVGLAEMLKGGVIMDVVNAEQARIAEEAGAVAVMALERVPSDIRKDGGVARMSDPEMI